MWLSCLEAFWTLYPYMRQMGQDLFGLLLGPYEQWQRTPHLSNH